MEGGTIGATLRPETAYDRNRFARIVMEDTAPELRGADDGAP